ncbi:galactose-1-epimerase [Vibrio sp. 10N.261.55.A7]|uniref:galactose-1-epimerase n=1 Tax=Vibrio sp. 10N.261.55.A7 TaxID=1880851 RepID=UPI000CC563EF|nr:galactose-1-epimerase [Vibrio sp. 10N.261.55.A7]PMJ92599.1 galactose-1-epimerase [Vibrio sp. 10N.261.55.A7]
MSEARVTDTPSAANLQQLEVAMTSTPAFDGKKATVIHLSNSNGMTASFMDIGATWLSARLPVGSEHREVLLRAANMEEYIKHSAFIGAVVGRFANRICKGSFSISGEAFSVGTNNGNNALHGGLDGFDKRRWLVESQSDNHVVFALESPHGDQGFPGNLSAKVLYTLTEDNAIKIDYMAEVDSASPVNLTNHAYFNLAGESSQAKSQDHSLQIAAPHFLPTNDESIPTGELRSVVGSSFDFTQMKRIGSEFLADHDQEMAGGYDHSFVFDEKECDADTVVATLVSPQQDVVMKVKTTKPAVQFYSGNFLAGCIGASKRYQNFDGLALETQYFPDGPNRPEWGENRGILEAGEPYSHTTIYQFEF